MFNCCESDLEGYYWRYTFYELAKRIELKVGEKIASHMAIFTSFAEVAARALGGKDKKTEDLTNLEPAAYAGRVSNLLSAI